MSLASSQPTFFTPGCGFGAELDFPSGPHPAAGLAPTVRRLEGGASGSPGHREEGRDGSPQWVKRMTGTTYSGEDSGVRLDISSGVGTANRDRESRCDHSALSPARGAFLWSHPHRPSPPRPWAPVSTGQP